MLIATHMAHEAVEFDCTAEEEAALLDGTPTPHHPLRIGRRLIVHLDDPTPLVERLHQRDPDDQRTLIVRPSNLEDVFLQLTGTSLESDT
jgi:hypothetical protein